MAFEFVEFSPQQLRLLNWWREGSPYRSHDIVLADGAIRSGKTIAGICSFLQWSQTTHHSQVFILAGKSIGALKRNVIFPLLKIIESWGWTYQYNRSENWIKIGSNTYYMFGANTEASQDFLVGLTAAGAFADEAALFPESFLNQMIGRCSVADSRLFLNCNPVGGVQHSFYKNFIAVSQEKNIYYMKFRMQDNYSLPASTIARYERAFKGVWYNRNVKGEWVVADGLIYPHFAENSDSFLLSSTFPHKPLPHEPRSFMRILVGVDWGDNKAFHSFVACGITHKYNSLVALASEKHAAQDLTPNQVEDLVTNFVEKIIQKYGRVDMVSCDHINTLINGCRVAFKRRGLVTPIGQAYKAPVLERILTTIKVMGLSQFYMTKDCITLAEAFCTAVWNPDPDKENERLDDGSSDIDTLDAFEYCWSSYLDLFSIAEV